MPVERSEGGADYRDAFSGSKRNGASFEADVPMRLAALLDHMEQRSSEVLSGSAGSECVAMPACARLHWIPIEPCALVLICALCDRSGIGYCMAQRKLV